MTPPPFSGSPTSIRWASFGPVMSVAFGKTSSDKSLLASGGGYTVRLWSPITGKPIGRPLDHGSEVRSIAFGKTSQGLLVVASGGGSSIRLWDPATGDPIGRPLDHGSEVRSIAFGRTSQGLVVASGGGSSIRLWDPATRNLIGELDHDSPVSSVAFGETAGGELLLAVGGGRSVQLWDPVLKQKKGDPMSHDSVVSSVAFGRTLGDELLLASAGGRLVQLWNADSMDKVGAPLLHTESVESVDFRLISGGQLLLASVENTGTGDAAVRIWDANTGELAYGSIKGHSNWVRSVALDSASDGSLLLAFGGNDRALRVWTPGSGEQFVESSVHGGPVNSIALGVTAEGTPILASGGDDHVVRVWNPDSGELGQEFLGHHGPVTSVALGKTSEGASLLASGGVDNAVRVWDLASKTLISEVPARSGKVSSVAFGMTFDDRLLLAFGIVDGGAGSIRVRSLDSGSEPVIDNVLNYYGPANSLALGTTLEGRLLLAAGSGRQVRLWDAVSGQQVGKVMEHRNQVSSVDLGRSSEGALLLAAASPDGTIQLWDVDGSPIGDVLNHQSQVSSVAFGRTSEGELYLASGGVDGSVRVWDVLSRQPIGKALQGSSGQVKTVAFVRKSNGELLLASGSDDGSVAIWKDRTIGPPQFRLDVLASGDDEQTNDLLGREVLVHHLVGVLNQLVGSRGDEDNMKGTVVVNLDGRWGAGKTVLSRLTTDHLAASPEMKDGKPSMLFDPIVIPFNAWQQSTVGPRWWTLIAEVKRHVERERAFSSRIALQTVGMISRLSRSRSLLFAGLLVAALAVVVLWYSQPGPPPAASHDDPLTLVALMERLDGVGKAIGGITALALIALGLGRILFWASPTIGKLYLKTEAKPLSEVSEILARLRRWSPRRNAPLRIADTLLGMWLLLILAWGTYHVVRDPAAATLVPEPVKEWFEGLSINVWAFHWKALDLRPDHWIPACFGVFVAIAAISAGRRRSILNNRSKNGTKSETQSSRSGYSSKQNGSRKTPQHSPLLSRVLYTVGLPWRKHPVLLTPFVSLLGAFCGYILVSSVPSLGSGTLATAIGLCLIGIGGYCWWLKKGLREGRRPIILVVDDLDRCSAKDTVEYLETIHTLMRPGSQPRLFTRWRTPAPFVVVVLADGRWVRTAFERWYEDFEGLGNESRQLGADFIMKMFDHTVLVPELTFDQVQNFIDLVTELPSEDSAGSGESLLSPTGDGEGKAAKQPEDSPGTAAESGQDGSGSDDDVPSSGDGEGTEPSIRRPRTERRSHVPEDIAAKAEEEASAEATAERTKHLITTYPHLMPGNPRLIRRVVNTLGMLKALRDYVAHEVDDDTLVRAAVLATMFPTLMDELLSSAQPIRAADIWEEMYVGPWKNPDVLNVLRKGNGSGAVLVEPEDLGRCYGRQYRSSEI